MEHTQTRTRTEENLYAAFVGEAKAYFRLLAYAEKAQEEELPQISHMFRAIAEAERVHTLNHLRLLGEVVVEDTDSNLEASFQRETTVNGVYYPDFIKTAEEEGNRRAAILFSQARDVEETHVKLYDKALKHLISEQETDYYVCKVCGYTSDGKLPDKCPVCGARAEMFVRVE